MNNTTTKATEKKLRRVCPGLYVAGNVHVAYRSRAYMTVEGWYVEYTDVLGGSHSKRFGTLREAREFVVGSRP